MCGIVGLWAKNKKSLNSIRPMTEKLHHRGPDGTGTWRDDDAGIAFGHKRLSIVDLSDAGHQPMLSASGRYVMVFNGEIYNFRDLQNMLPEDIKLSGHSDTESLLALIELLGLEQALVKCTGMFALALWDRKERNLLLARDRFGEKPLYFGQLGDDFIFTSELKILKTHPTASTLTIDRHALSAYVRYGYVPTPYCIYEGFNKLQPGTYLQVNADLSTQATVYWSAIDTAIHAKPFQASFDEAVESLEQKLEKTIAQQTLADVPLGAFLSGGIDSSSVVALMQKHHIQPVKTFSIGFFEQEFNEAEHAKAVAKHLGTDHHEIYVTQQDALNVVPKLPEMYDEPFADSSQIPTFLVSQLAKEHVTVSLSGDAGDELFGGYGRYLLTPKLKHYFIDLPLLSFMVQHQPTAILHMGSVLFGKRFARISDRLSKLQVLLRKSGKSPQNLYQNFCSQYLQSDQLVNMPPYPLLSESKVMPALSDSLYYQEWMMLADTLTYLNDDILTKVDRAAMAVSLETRVPFLDHEIYEFAWQLPLSYKIYEGKGKTVLREVLYRHVPKALIDRPKQGFGVPIANWFRNELREWAETLLDESTLREQDYFDTRRVRNLWQEHLSDRRNWSYVLWNILMFQAWQMSAVKNASPMRND